MLHHLYAIKCPGFGVSGASTKRDYLLHYVSVYLSIHPTIGLSVHMEPGSYWTEFHEILYEKKKKIC
jgi:hypothetical protein